MNIQIRHAWVLSAGLAAATACDGRSLSPEAPEIPSATRSAPASPAAPAVNPLATLQPAHADFEGIVAERIRTGGYAYLRVDTGASSQWVATMGKGRPSGSPVHVHSLGVRHAFHSRRLDRDFGTLVFASISEATEGGIR